MSNNRHPLQAEDFARIDADADAMLDYLKQHGRPALEGRLSVIGNRQRIARALGITVLQLARAEQALCERRLIQSRALIPRNEYEAAKPKTFRWIVLPEGRNAS